jgi:hypothetical protein
MLQNFRRNWIAVAAILIGLAVLWNLGTVKQAISQGIQTVKILSGSVTADTEFSAAAAAGDSVGNVTAPYANVFLHLWDATGSVWKRAQAGLTDTDDGTIAASQVPMLSASLGQNFDGTNWKRLLSAANALNSTGAGLNTAQIIGQFDDSSPTSITENQFGNLRMSANRNLYGTIRDAAGNERGLNVDANGEIGIGAIRSALPAGTNAIGKLAANSGVDIGDVDVTTNNLSSIASTAISAHDGNTLEAPLLTSGYAETTEDSDGNTNGNRVSADGDKVRLLADRNGTLYVRNGPPHRWSYHENSSSALTDTTVHASCGTGLYNYIESITFSTGAATAASILIEDSTTATILGPYYLEAVSGRGLHVTYPGGKKQTTSATLISVTTTGAIAHGLDIIGFCAP